MECALSDQIFTSHEKILRSLKANRMLHSEPFVGKTIEELRRCFLSTVRNSLNVKSFNHQLELVWQEIFLPIYTWLKMWRDSITERTEVVEMRKHDRILLSIFKIIHRFFYSLLETCLRRYPGIQHSQIGSELNIDITLQEFDNKIITNTFIGPILRNIIAKIGLNHYYVVLGKAKTLKNSKLRYKLSDFRKACKYYEILEKNFPNPQNLHFKAQIMDSCENYLAALSLIVRDGNLRVDSAASCRLLEEIALQQSWRNCRRRNDSKSYSFLELLSYFASIVGKDYKITNKHLTFLQSFNAELRLEKRPGVLLDMVIICVSWFYVLFDIGNLRRKTPYEIISRKSLSDLNKSHQYYLNFCFSTFEGIIDQKIRTYGLHSPRYEFLAIVRVMVCWIKSNRSVLQLSKTHAAFCQSFARLLNDIYSLENFDINSLNHRPVRHCLFDEDDICRNLSCIDYSLTDFRDDFDHRSSGKCTLADSFVRNLRLNAIAVSGQRFMIQNRCGITWNGQRWVI